MEVILASDALSVSAQAPGSSTMAIGPVTACSKLANEEQEQRRNLLISGGERIMDVVQQSNARTHEARKRSAHADADLARLRGPPMATAPATVIAAPAAIAAPSSSPRESPTCDSFSQSLEGTRLSTP